MEELVPNEFYLCQYSPNPFSVSTKIKYCLPLKSEVNLTIFNSAGKKVKELVNSIQEAGTYEILVNGSDFIEGEYYYKIEVFDLESGLNKVFNDNKQMLFTK